MDLTVKNITLELRLTDDVIEALAESIASELLSGFAVDWSPNWVRPGDVHAWQEDSGWMARCGTCLADSPPAPSRDDAVAWARQHELAH
jgi:hypothetical protein